MCVSWYSCSALCDSCDAEWSCSLFAGSRVFGFGLFALAIVFLLEVALHVLGRQLGLDELFHALLDSVALHVLDRIRLELCGLLEQGLAMILQLVSS